MASAAAASMPRQSLPQVTWCHHTPPQPCYRFGGRPFRHHQTRVPLNACLNQPFGSASSQRRSTWTIRLDIPREQQDWLCCRARRGAARLEYGDDGNGSGGGGSGRPRLCSSDPTFLRRQRVFRLPVVDWSRQNIQVLFVDRKGTVRSPMAAGVFQRIVDWNGWSGMVQTEWSGIEADEGVERDVSRAAACLSLAPALGIPSSYMARPPLQFVADDLYRYDIIIALDDSVMEAVRDVALKESSSEHTNVEYYRFFNARLSSLTDFIPWVQPKQLLARGSTSLLDPALSGCLRRQSAVRPASKGVRQPQLAEDGPAEWNRLIVSIVIGCAALCRYLKDSSPDADS